MLLSLVLAGLLGLQGQAPDGPRAVLRRAAAAVESDSVAELRSLWEAEARPPRSDRLARLGLATLAQLTYDLTGADTLLASLLPAADEPPDAVSVRARLALAQSARARGTLTQAERELTTALEEARAVGAPEAVTEALILLAVTRARTVGPTGAEPHFLEAEPRAADDPYLGAMLHCGRAEVSVLRSRPAAEDALLGIELAEQAGDQRMRSWCLGALASDRARTGDVDGALADMGLAAEIRRRLGDQIGLAAALQWRGYWLRTIGRLEEARAELEEGLEVSRRFSTGGPRAWIYSNLAFIDLAVGNTRAGAAMADSAARLFAEQGDRYGEGAIEGARGDLALTGGDPEGAREAYRRSLEVLEPLGFASGVVAAWIGLAHADLSQARWEEAEHHLDSAQVVAQAAGMRGRLQGLTYHRAVLALKRGRLDEAEAVISSALVRVEGAWKADPRRGQHDWMYYYRMRLAEIRARQGDLDGAERLTAEAMDGIEAWRATLSFPELRLLAFQVAEDRSDPDLGFATIVAALAEGGRAKAAFALADRLRGRNLRDQLARIEAPADTAPDPAGATGGPPPATSAADVLAGLPDEHTAMLVWVTGRGGEPTTLFALGPFGVRARVLPPVDSVAPDVRRLDAMIRSGEHPESLAKRVTTAVLGDVSTLLSPGVRRVVLVPDGPLHLVPFEALTDATGTELVERFAFSVQPSASLAVREWRRPSPRASPTVLAMGDPRPPAGAPAERRDGGADLRPLPNALREARHAARHGGPGSEALLRTQASEARLKSLPPGRFGVLHFATHARLDEASLARAALLLAPGDGEDGVVRAGEVARLRLDAGLAFLSGCATASGTVVRGEGVVGLASALRVAGVRTVILTRWPLEDRAAAPLVDDVYAGLAEGLPVGDAVRRARLEARERGAPASVWATLTVVGDERLTVPLRKVRPWRRVALALAAVGLLAVGAAVLHTRRRRNEGSARMP